MRTSVALRASARGTVETSRHLLGVLGLLAGVGCSSGAHFGSEPPVAAAGQTDAPLVSMQPGAWFDASGSLTVVGPGRRLRLVLSAPVSACTSALEGAGAPEQVAQRASLPFHLVSEVCRDTHPSVLLAEEGDTASPAELERNYHEVARCAGADLGLSEGWRPDIVQGADPCPLALGLGWRLPTLQELSGLSLDDRKAIAGALFDTEVLGPFGTLLVYARTNQGEVALATLSPNASDQAPQLASQKRDQPLFGAALRCVREAIGKPPPVPVLPHASACLQEHRKSQVERTAAGAAPPPDLQKLKTWLNSAELRPALLRAPQSIAELAQLLASPTLERLAREERDERALTERYAELAEGVDDPAVSAAERRRRREEFAHLRRRLGGQIVQSAEGASAGRRQFGAVLTRLRAMLTAAAGESAPKRGPRPSYEPILSRLRELGATTTP